MTSTLPGEPRTFATRASLADLAVDARDRTRSLLLSTQHPDGYWEEPLVCDTTTDSDLIIYLRVMGRSRPAIVAGLTRRILAEQLPDGGWNIYPDGASEINATVKAYVALKLAGADID